MTETNPAEAEAEKILTDAYPEARAEVCPQGENCGVHFRVDEEFIEDDGNFARIITYVGEYAVLTDDNPEMFSMTTLLGAALGVVTTPPRWETAIYHVGDGVLGDIANPEETRQACRYAAKHDDWEGVKGFHSVTVSGLAAGLIDVSKPLEG